LQKLADEDYDAMVLAAAGLARLGLSDQITQYFTPEEFVPASGQAVLAAEFRQDDTEILKLLTSIQDEDTLLACQAERIFTEIIGGGCKLPVGCYAKIEGKKATIYGTVGSMDAKDTVMKLIQGEKSEVIELATNLAKELLGESARRDW
jgi:hydroxymethylbilane synthase